MALGISAHAFDIPYFWLEKPSGRSNPNDPANPAHRSSGPALPVLPVGTATVTPTAGPSFTSTPTPTTAPSSTRDVQVKYAGGAPLPGAVVMINSDTANTVTTGADGWAHLPLVTGKVDVHIFMPELSPNSRGTVSFLGVAQNPFHLILPDGSGTPTPTPGITNGSATVFVRITYTGEAAWFNNYQYNWAYPPCAPSGVPTVRTQMDGGIGTVIGYVAHYSAWEMDCAGVTKTAVFVPPYTWTAGSQTVTAAVQSTGFSTALLALTAPGHTPWTSQKRVWYSSGTGPDHLWSGGYNQMDVTATAFNYAVIYPDWATHHQLRLEASLTLGSAQAMFDRTLTYTAVPLAAVLPFPSNPFFTVLPTDAARTAVIPLDNAFPINFGKLEMGQLSGGVTRFWTVFFDQGTYNLQAPLTLTLPPTPATAAFHGFVPGQTTITNAYFYERPGYDLYTAIDSFPITNEVETYQIHDVGTW